MKIKTVHELFKNRLADIYDAEKQLLEAFPKIADSATHRDLDRALRDHMDETKDHIERIEEVISALHLDPGKETCDATKGLLTEIDELLSRIDKGDVLDVAIITAIQKIEHYEIASYGCLCAIAKGLGHDKAAKILHKTLEEERDVDKTLTKLAKKQVNTDALKKAA